MKILVINRSYQDGIVMGVLSLMRDTEGRLWIEAKTLDDAQRIASERLKNVRVTAYREGVAGPRIIIENT